MSAQPTVLENYLLELVNGTRAAAGIAPLTLDDGLMNSADRHGTWMNATDSLTNLGADGSSVESVWSFYGTDETGEWASAIPHFVEAAHESFINSPGDYQIMVNPNFQEIGVSLLEGDYLGYPAVFMTLDFGAPSIA